jgi:hypothetical protein
MDAKAATHQFHSDFLPSYFWGFNGKYPAETPLNFYGLPTLVRFKNSLPAEGTHANGGRAEITVHLHNGHTGSESDGFAGDFFPTGFFKDNHYANVYAGVDAFGGIGNPLEAMHTFWFHDHRARWTAPNNSWVSTACISYTTVLIRRWISSRRQVRFGFRASTDLPTSL